MKTLKNSGVSSAHSNVPDLQTVGNSDSFQLICKAYSEKEGWMKSTKAYEIAGAGCLVQVTTQQGENVAEALAWVPGVVIIIDNNGGRRLMLKDSFPRGELIE